MASSSYRIGLCIRTAFLCLTLYLFFFLLMKTSFVLTTALVGVASVLQCVSLIVSVDRSNRNLARFLRAIRDNDFAQSPSFPKDPSFARLKAEYEPTIQALRKHRLEGERQRRYAEIIAESAGIGFLVFEEGGRVDS
jgi:two-component system, NtrC family, nitrogen regulation sensor histidine kinase NtrY